MLRIIRRERARRDLSRLWNYIAEASSEERADDFLRRIVNTFGTLATSPGIGRVRDDLKPGLRSHPVGRYVIYYFPLDDGIRVVRVLHGSRDIPTIFEEEEAEGDEQP